MSSYRDLKVWQAAMDLTTEIYAFTDTFPKEERFGLSQQMRRAAVSIVSNIAEGHGRKTHKQRFSFLENALGSTFELETQLELCQRLGYDAERASQLSRALVFVGRGLSGLLRHVESDATANPFPRP